MVQVGIAEVKARFSEYLARVRAGEEIVVTDRGRPVARLGPMAGDGRLAGEEALNDLARAGIVRVGEAPIPPAFWKQESPADPEGAVRRALTEEREHGR